MSGVVLFQGRGWKLDLWQTCSYTLQCMRTQTNPPHHVGVGLRTNKQRYRFYATHSSSPSQTHSTCIILFGEVCSS